MMNIDGIRAFLKNSNIDGWLIYDFGGLNPVAQKLLNLRGKVVTRRIFCFVSERKTMMLVHEMETQAFMYFGCELVTYSSLKSFKSGLRKILRGAKRVAMEYSPNCDIPYISKVDAGTVELVEGMGVEVVSSANLFQAAEAVWSEKGFELHKSAARKIVNIKDEAFEYVGQSISEGGILTEYDVQKFIMKRFRKEKLKTLFAPLVAVNENSSLPHYQPNEKVHSNIERGDFLLIDLSAKEDHPEGIYADITWVSYVGKRVPQKHSKIFNIVKGARDSVVSYLRDGLSEGRRMKGWQLDKVARDYIEEKGYGKYFIHRTGHSLGDEHVHGLGMHLDNYETKDNRLVMTGFGFTVEPGIYLQEFGVRSEIDVYIDEEQPIVTTPLQDRVISII